MNTIQRQILVGLEADVAHWAARRQKYSAAPDVDGREARERELIALARRGVARCDPAKWLAREITPAGSTAVQRAYAALEAAGLVEKRRLGFGGAKVTHLAITRAGESKAREIAKGESDAGLA